MHILTTEPDWENDPLDVICGVPNWFPVTSERAAAHHGPRTWNPVNPQRRSQIVELLKSSKLSYTEIATEVGVSKTSVYRIAGRTGLGRGSAGHNQHTRRR